MQRPWRQILTWTAWPLTLAVLAGAAVLALSIRDGTQEELSQENAPTNVSAHGVQLDDETIQLAGLTYESAQSVEWTPRITAYGRVVPNPAATAEVRTRYAGTLRLAKGHDWPRPGDTLQAGETFGQLLIRVDPQQRIDLMVRLNEAKANKVGADKVVNLTTDRIGRLRAAGEAVARVEVDTALTQLADAEARSKAAQATVESWEQAIAALDNPESDKNQTWMEPLIAPITGEVLGLPAQPGEAMEAGVAVLRLTNFDSILIRVEFPPHAIRSHPPSKIRLTPIAAPNQPGEAELVGLAPDVEAISQYPAYWYRRTLESPSIGNGPAIWRPGLVLRAEVPDPMAEPRKAVMLPAGSVLYHEGRPLVYVRTSEGRYERRPVEVLGKEKEQWIISDGVQAGEHVVNQRAQVLLSEEFRGEADED